MAIKEDQPKTNEYQLGPEENFNPFVAILPAPSSWLYYPTRALVLFVLGFVFSVIIDVLQTQNSGSAHHHHREFAQSSAAAELSRLFHTASWVPPACGLGAVVVGTIFPLSDYHWGNAPHTIERDWTSVVRSVGGFSGVAYAATKLPWSSNVQISWTLAIISFALWFLFDRTMHGFGLALLISFIGTIAVYVVVAHGLYSFSHGDIYGVRTWVPCILYSSCICFGTIGRQLEVIPGYWYRHRRPTRVL